MYDVVFESAAGTLRLGSGTEYNVNTISGLTGITATFNTAQRNQGAGVAVVSSSISSKQLTINGSVLDENTAAKQRFMDFFKPAAELVMYINSTRTTTDTQRAYKSRVFVKSSPTLTQEKHSIFTLGLLMPQPFWEDVTEYVIPFDTVYEVKGDIAPQFDLTITASQTSPLIISIAATDANNPANVQTLTLRGAGVTAGDTIRVYRNENGALKVYQNNTLNMGMLYANNELWYLPLGKWVFEVVSGGTSADALLKYTPLYSGVLVDGV